jgi:hypothetical protein
VSSLYLRQALDGPRHHATLLATLDRLAALDPARQMYYRDESVCLCNAGHAAFRLKALLGLYIKKPDN